VPAGFWMFAQQWRVPPHGLAWKNHRAATRERNLESSDRMEAMGRGAGGVSTPEYLARALI
jgi:hypothetical protein